MVLDEQFLEAEERKGFYIRSMMKRVWACQMEMLEQFDKACRKHGIRYFADAGTLLGAVREQGYIPWDDDLDIGMLRTEYERFKKSAFLELPKEYRLENDRSDGCNISDLVVHLRNGERLSMAPDHLMVHYGCPYVVCIDISVYDNLPDDAEERKVFSALYQNVFWLIWQVEKDATIKDCPENVKEIILDLERLTGFSFQPDRAIRVQLYVLLDYLSASYCKTDSEQVAIMGYYMHNEKIVIKREWIEESSYMPFEKMQVPVPIGYDELLKVWYGDYRIPVQQKGDHDYPYFRSQEAKLIEEYKNRGWKIPDYILQ